MALDGAESEWMGRAGGGGRRRNHAVCIDRDYVRILLGIASILWLQVFPFIRVGRVNECSDSKLTGRTRGSMS